MVDERTRKILEKYGARIEGQIKTEAVNSGRGYSREYLKFKDEMAPQLSRYERWCNTLGNVIKLKPSKKDEERLRKALEIAHLDVEPEKALTLSVMSFLSVFLLGLISSVAIALIKGGIEEFPVLFFLLVIGVSIFLFMFVGGYPERLANQWRLKASSQMVPAILYVVVYMRHTPNLEKAIAFAAEHLDYPLGLDLKKVFYNVEIGKFSTIKESLDNYLEIWRGYSSEFIEAFHLIESSLFEPDEGRRIGTLEKSLQVVLDGVYDKMLKFSHDVRSPLTNVYMLGVVLPTLSLALLPLASAMVKGAIGAVHLFLLFNLIVPFFVYYLTDKVLLMRPGGYGQTRLLEKNPLYPEYKSKKHFYKSFLVAFPFILLGLFPLIFHYFGISSSLGLNPGFTFGDIGLPFMQDVAVFGFKELPDGRVVGPFGIGALLFGLFLPLGIALFFSLAYKWKTKKIILEREKTKSLEREFNSSLFQLGNRIGNGIPPELAFGKVAESSRGLKTEDFFRRVDFNIRQGGMSVERAIFDPRRGAIIFYPSELISTSMRILIESSKKGLKIAAVSLMSISEYVKNIQKITERLKDLLAEIVSDMKSNMTFLAPLLAGIVVGLSVVIVTILSKLNLQALSSEGAGESFSGIISLFSVNDIISPYYLQLSVGIYLLQIVFILTSTLVTINSGQDKLEKAYLTGNNIAKGMILFFLVAFASSVVLFGLANIVLGGGLG